MQSSLGKYQFEIKLLEREIQNTKEDIKPNNYLDFSTSLGYIKMRQMIYIIDGKWSKYNSEAKSDNKRHADSVLEEANNKVLN